MKNNLTKHCSVRMQQRGIPPLVIDWLLDFGLQQRQGEINVLYFNKNSKRKIKQYAGAEALSIFQKYENAYAIASANDDKIITVGYKSIRLQRDRNQRVKR